MFVSPIRTELSPDRLEIHGQDKQLIKTSDPGKILVFFIQDFIEKLRHTECNINKHIIQY